MVDFDVIISNGGAGKVFASQVDDVKEVEDRLEKIKGYKKTGKHSYTFDTEDGFDEAFTIVMKHRPTFVFKEKEERAKKKLKEVY